MLAFYYSAMKWTLSDGDDVVGRRRRITKNKERILNFCEV
jgi:hypothetical protein